VAKLTFSDEYNNDNDDDHNHYDDDYDQDPVCGRRLGHEPALSLGGGAQGEQQQHPE